jgi:broad specificity phosphatase PhoE
MKNIVLIRHGESLGQTARQRGIDRKDVTLTDCFLSSNGIRQATELRSNKVLQRYRFDLVCTSPLSRALATTVLGLGSMIEEERSMKQLWGQHAAAGGKALLASPRSSRKFTPFIACADICEFGGKIPENQGRPLHQLRKDLKQRLSIVARSSTTTLALDSIDFTMLPPSWPDMTMIHDGTSDRIANFLAFLQMRPEKNIAIVCHCGTIKQMLKSTGGIDRVPNCMPIECILTDEGELVLKSEFVATPVPSRQMGGGVRKLSKRMGGRELPLPHRQILAKSPTA